jgi:hypothetical protein
MEKITLENISKLTIEEIATLSLEILLELETAAEEHLIAAKRYHSWINGAIAIRNLRHEKLMEARYE